MAPQLWSVHLVGDSSDPRAEALRNAARTVRPDVVIRESCDLSAAVAAASDASEVLIFTAPTIEDLKLALGTVDQRGLPRWAVVEPSLGEPERGAESANAWQPPALARAITFARSLLVLRRENARLCGDLHTVARRLTHDLRTPLNSISTANEALAALGLAAEPAPTLHRAIAGAVEDTGALIERVATVLGAAVRPMVIKAVDMEEVVWNARERSDTRIRSAGATIVAPEKWPVVNGVAFLLEHVWSNLLMNSVAHGGLAPRIELGWKRAGSETTFWVRDSGPGVAPAKRGQLFHPFDRLNELNAPRGYGLSLVHRLIEIHGGTTGYVPDPPPGGTFYFTLPEPASLA